MNRIKWLEKLIQERFSKDLSLGFNDKFYEITCDSSEKVVQVLKMTEVFQGSSSSIPCVFWDARNTPWETALMSSLPAPGLASVSESLIAKNERGIAIHYDVLSMAFWMMTRQEEIEFQNLDHHGRFPATASHAFKHGYLERPVVDEWFHILKQVLKITFPSISIIKHSFSILPSHDVDNINRYSRKPFKTLTKTFAIDIIKYKDLFTFLKFLIYRKLVPTLKHRYIDPYNRFDWLMDVSDDLRIKSSFYFITSRTNHDYDADYDIYETNVQQLISRISQRGHSIGLHPSYETYLSPELIKREADILKNICNSLEVKQVEWGGRMHYLRIQVPTTLYGWEEGKMTYDSSLGYADLPGFRCGTCFDYQAFDPVHNRTLDLRIRPLVAMECSVISKRFMGLGISKEALRKFLDLKNACKSVGGNFTLLWHNSSLISQEERALYYQVLHE